MSALASVAVWGNGSERAIEAAYFLVGLASVVWDFGAAAGLLVFV